MAANKKDPRVLNKMVAMLKRRPVPMFEIVHTLNIPPRTVYRYLKHIDEKILCELRVVRVGKSPVRYWIPN